MGNFYSWNILTRIVYIRLWIYTSNLYIFLLTKPINLIFVVTDIPRTFNVHFVAYSLPQVNHLNKKLVVSTVVKNFFFRYRSYVSKSDITRSKICEIASHIPFCILFTLQAIMAYMFWLAYGTLAFILGPLRTWSVILAAILYYFALKLPEKCLL